MAALCLLDLDQTVLDGRTIDRLAAAFHLEDAVAEALRCEDGTHAGPLESARVMQVFAGVDADAFDAACSGAPLRQGAMEALAALRGAGHEVAVATASYTHVARDVAARIGAIGYAALEPEIVDGRLTGRHLPSPWDGPCGRPVCKATIVRHWRLRADAVVAIGDGSNDVCMFEEADAAIAMAPCHPEARAAADAVARHWRDVPALVEALLVPKPLARRPA